MHDFDKTVLLFEEELALLKFKFKKKVPEESLGNVARSLVSLGLIKRNYTDQKNIIGERIPDGTYSLTDLYSRYRKYQRQQFRKSFVYPLIVAFFTALVTAIITVKISVQ